MRLFVPLCLLAPSAVLTLAASIDVSKSFDVKKHLGNLAPPFTPSFGLAGGLGVGMPDECSLQQVQLLHRHGSRFPLTSEHPLIANLSTKLNDPTVSARIDSLRLPEEWKFIQGEKRWSNTLSVENLTVPGRRESFDHGVEFRLTYPDMPFEHILAGNQGRVIESAQWFRAGMFGGYEDDISSLSLIAEDNVTISEITSQDTCPNWTYSSGQSLVNTWGAIYLPRIASRINTDVLKKAAVELTPDDVHGALYACAYELAAFGNTTWCGVFEDSEIEEFEYELDLLMRGAFGYGLPGNMGPVLGSVFVDNLVDRLTNPSANKTYIEFGHDTTIDLAFTALDLAADKKYPTTGPPNPSRNWRTSTQVHFSSHMVWEKWNCSSSTQVRLLLNGAPFSLSPVCKADKKTGACVLDDFVKATEAIRSVKWGDATWNATCGNPGF